ncbi:hypothetical protein MLD38_024088 [Melastoma candidum]|uniref:Uncharacterized protein n=1 Tax=Melastoma candidum TaxID=119954 RepID=A0ACB9NSY5_9MYRT|nr:hypothetical protein MLD38_024088 [Melastoma candidum]
MSPAAKSKSKAKSSSRSAKEQKSASKVSAPTNGRTGISSSACNPVSSTFHVLEVSSPASSPPSQSNCQFQTMDDTDDHSSSPHGTLSEYDSVSNNGSCSGESEDSKDKVAGPNPKREILPSVDNDKRGKIRLKNEKKHQRQKERRAQELHERCCGYLMSRKLEALSRQLVTMGFSSERATLALILNEGRLEDSISWLFDASEEAILKNSKLGSKGSLKINISNELAQISELEIKYKCSKQEVERAIVASEGDLGKAEETLRSQKHDLQPLAPELVAIPASQRLVRVQDKSTPSSAGSQARSERDHDYLRAVPTRQSGLEHGMSNLRLQPSQVNQHIEVGKKRWPAVGLNSSPSPTIAMRSQVSPVPTRRETLHGGAEDKTLLQPAAREQPLMMQHHSHASVPRTNMVSTVSTSFAGSLWFYPSEGPGMEMLRPNMKLLHAAQRLATVGQDNRSSEQIYHHPATYRESPTIASPFDSLAELGSTWTPMGRVPSPTITSIPPQGSWSKFGQSSSSYMQNSSHSLGTFSNWMPSASLSSPSVVRDDDSGLRLGVAANRMQLSGMSWAKEWTSPFAGKDIFLPRQFVTSPSP